MHSRSRIGFPGLTEKGVLAIALSQFGMTFSLNFILVILPFYILAISPLSHQATMIWIGLIMASASFTTTLVAPLWGALTAKLSPKSLFELGMFGTALVILSIGFTNNIYLLFVLRLTQGAMSGVSTIGLILTSALSSQERIRSNLSLYQNSLTAGQLLGPPAGAYAAKLLGYHSAFFLTFFLILIAIAFCHVNVQNIPAQGKAPRTKPALKKSLLFGWFLCMVASIHLNFMPTILPFITRATFHMKDPEAISAAGIIMMTYTAASIIGSYLLCRISDRVGVERVMVTALLVAGAFQVLLIGSTGMVSFVIIRTLQEAFVSAVFPLTISVFARQVGGTMIGFLNAARFFGNAVGPLLSASILAFAGLPTVYLFVAGLTFTALWFFLSSLKREETRKRSAQS